MTDPAEKSQRKIKLGEIVKVTVDRPLGSYHPEYPKMYYPVNYGYIEGVIAPDGEEQDAYILGVDEPVKEFTGEVIGIVHREDDEELKLVVAPEGSHFTADEVMHRIKFTEKYYKSHVVMKLYGIDIDAEDIVSLGFEIREDRNCYYLFRAAPPAKDQIFGLINLLSEKVDLRFWNFYHVTISDPGAYATVNVANGKAIIKQANHGWSSSHFLISFDDLAELIIRNWEQDRKRQKYFMNAVEIRTNIWHDDTLEMMKQPLETYVPDYSETAW